MSHRDILKFQFLKLATKRKLPTCPDFSGPHGCCVPCLGRVARVFGVTWNVGLEEVTEIHTKCRYMDSAHQHCDI